MRGRGKDSGQQAASSKQKTEGRGQKQSISCGSGFQPRLLNIVAFNAFNALNGLNYLNDFYG